MITSARSPARVAAIVLGVVALVLGSVGVDAHIATAAHGVCEHGADVHIERVGEAVPVPSPHAGPVLAAPEWWEVHGDDHCGATASIAGHAPLIAMALAVAPTLAVRLLLGVAIAISVATAAWRARREQSILPFVVAAPGCSILVAGHIAELPWLE